MANELEIQRLRNLLADPQRVLGRPALAVEIATWTETLRRLEAEQRTGILPPVRAGVEDFPPPETLQFPAPEAFRAAAAFPAPDELRALPQRREARLTALQKDLEAGLQLPIRSRAQMARPRRLGGTPEAAAAELAAIRALPPPEQEKRIAELEELRAAARRPLQAVAGFYEGLPIIGTPIGQRIAPPPETPGELAIRGAASVPLSIAGFGLGIRAVGLVTRLTRLAATSPKLSAMTNWGLASSAISFLNIDDRGFMERLKDAGVAGVESAFLAGFVTPSAKRAEELLKLGKVPNYTRIGMALRFGGFGAVRAALQGVPAAAPIQLTGNPALDAGIWDAIVAAVYANGRPKIGQRIPVAIEEPAPKPGQKITPRWTFEQAVIMNQRKVGGKTVYTLAPEKGPLLDWTYGEPIRRSGGRFQDIQDNFRTPAGQILKAGDMVTWSDKSGRHIGLFKGFHQDPNQPRRPKLLVQIPDALGRDQGSIAFVEAAKDIRILEGKALQDFLGARPPTRPGPGPAPSLVGIPGEEPPVPAPFGQPAPPSAPAPSATTDAVLARIRALREPRGAAVDAFMQRFTPGTDPRIVLNEPHKVEAGGHAFEVYYADKPAGFLGQELVKRLLDNLTQADLDRFSQQGIKFVASAGPFAGGTVLADADYATRTIRIDVEETAGVVDAGGRRVPPSAIDRMTISLMHEIIHQDTVDSGIAASFRLHRFTPEAADYLRAVGWRELNAADVPPDVVVRADGTIEVDLKAKIGDKSRVEEWPLTGGRSMTVLVYGDPDSAWRPLTPHELTEAPRYELVYRRQSPAEDIADTGELYASDPDFLRRTSPERFDAYLRFLTPRIIKGVAAEDNQLLLFPAQRRPGGAQPPAPSATARNLAILTEFPPAFTGLRAESRTPRETIDSLIEKLRREPVKETRLRLWDRIKMLLDAAGASTSELRQLEARLSQEPTGERIGSEILDFYHNVLAPLQQQQQQGVEAEPGVARPVLPRPGQGAESRVPPRDRLTKIIEAINAETDPARKAEMEAILETVVRPIDKMIEEVAGAKGVDSDALRTKALDEALLLAQRGAKVKQVRGRIESRADDLRRAGSGIVVGVGGSAELERVAAGLPPTPEGPGIPAEAKTQRIRGKLLGAIQNLKGTPEGQQQIAQALGKIQDANVREALKLAAGVDDNGRPVGNAIPLGEAAKQRGVTLKQLQDAIKVDPSGAFIIKEAAKAAAKAKPEAAKALGVPEVKKAADPVAAVIQKAREIDAALAARPTDDGLQRKASELRRKLAALQKQGPSLTPEQRAALKAAGYDPDAVQKTLDAEHPEKPPAEEPPPAEPGLRFPTSNDALVAEWKRLVDRIPRGAAAQQAFTKAIERAKALEAEMRRRNINFEPSGGFPGGKPPKGGHPRRKSKAPPPVEPIDRDYTSEVVPELDHWAIDAAKARGDLTPTRVIIRRKSDGTIIGNYSSQPLRPQLWAQTRFRVETFGFRPKVSEPPLGAEVTSKLIRGETTETPKLSGAFRFRVIDRLTGEEVGFFTPTQLRRFMAGQFIPGITTDPETGEMLPAAVDIAEDIRRSPPGETPIGAKIGTHNLQDVEFMNLHGSAQVAHIMKLVDNAQTADAAWGAWARYNGLVHNYESRAHDLEATLAHTQNVWGPPGPRFGDMHELIQIYDKIQSSYRDDRRAGVKHFLDYLDVELGGTGRAFNPANAQSAQQTFGDIYDMIVRPRKPVSGIDPGDVAPGRLTWLGYLGLMSPTRQNYLFGHPIAADLHMKTRFADRHADRRTAYYAEIFYRIMEGVSLLQEIAMRLWLEGRYEAHKTLGVPTRLLREDLTRRAPIGGRDIRNAISKLKELASGRVDITEVVIPEMTPELKQKALAIKQLMTEIADEAGLPHYQRIEQYWPHFFRKLGIGDEQYYELPSDWNVGNEIFFRFFQPRRHPDLEGYEIGMREVFDVYVRGAMRKAAFTPIVQEFNSPQVRNILPNRQREYLDDYISSVIGRPSGEASVLARAFRTLVEETPPHGYLRWVRRVVLGSQNPGRALAEIIRGYQFMRTLGLNAGFMATNLIQAPLTYLMRHKWSGYFDTLMQSGVFRDSIISRYFEATRIAGEVKRSELGLNIQRARGYISRALQLIAELIQATEVINRRQSFAAGFKVAKEAGLMDGEAVALGIMESDLTQFNMTKTGRLPLTRGPFGSVAFQFLQYGVEMSQLVGRELYNATGLRGAQAAKQGWTRLTKLMLAAHLIGGINAHIGPFLQLVHRFNRAVFGEEFDQWFDEALHLLDVASADYLLGTMTRGRPYEFGLRINPINAFFKFTSPLGPSLGQLTEVLGTAGLRGIPGAPNIGETATRSLPLGIALERAAGDKVQRYLLEPPARALRIPPRDIRLRPGRDVTERLLGREAAPGFKGRFRSDPAALKRLMQKLGLTP